MGIGYEKQDVISYWYWWKESFIMHAFLKIIQYFHTWWLIMNTHFYNLNKQKTSDVCVHLVDLILPTWFCLLLS